MNKRAKIHLLPTDKAENCIILDNATEKFKYSNGRFFTQEHFKYANQSSHHLYITTDDEIKEGDWCLFFWDGMKDGELGQVGSEPQQYLPSEGHTLNRNLRKIIATTDPELKWSDDNELQILDYHFAKLPQPSKEFIEEYCKAGGIDEVDVEYELKPTLSEGDDYYIGGEVRKVISVWKGTNDSWYVTTPKNHGWSCPVQEYPKLTSNNEIIIHPIEEKMYSRDEVYKIAKVAYRIGAQNHNDATVERFDEWIKTFL